MSQENSAPKEDLFVTECPRDAMQGIRDFIPTEQKIAYLRCLLRVGFSRLDCGSFVSAKAIPQMRDTRLVMEALEKEEAHHEASTQLLAIVGNERGAKEAGGCRRVDCLGFPWSVCAEFQQRNVGKSVDESFEDLLRIRDIATQNNQQTVVYVSMAFGNPYGAPYHEEMIMVALDKLRAHNFPEVALADTVGVADENHISRLCRLVSGHFPSLSVGLHLHTVPKDAQSKITAAHEAGCRHFDTAIGGHGGCPMAQDELIGNLPTEHVMAYAKARSLALPVRAEEWHQALRAAGTLFHA